MSAKLQAEFLYQAVDRFADWVKFADAKAGAVLVVLAIGATDLISHASRFVHAHESSGVGVAASISFWAAAVLATGAVVFVVLTLFPRVTPRSGASLFHFGSVASYQAAQDFRAKVATLKSEDDLAAELAPQAWELARIASAKMGFVRAATGFALAFLVTWAVGRFLLGIR